MTKQLRHALAFPRHDLPELCRRSSLQRTEGTGNAGRAMHPQPCVRNEKAHKRSHHRFTGFTPAFPARMVLTASFVLSPETGLCCLRHRRKILRRFSASVGAPRPHDFAVREWCIRLVHRQRPPHPAPTLVTMANVPLIEAGWRGILKVICPTTQGQFFRVMAGRSDQLERIFEFAFLAQAMEMMTAVA